MIVWLASFPRSGNTFFRILLHSLYGASTYTGFQSGDDLELDVGAGELTGNKRLPEKLMLARRAKDPKAVLREFDAHDEVYFIKTHNLPSELYDDEHRTLLFVRDPRDTFVSFGWWIINVEGAWRRLGRRFRLGMPQLPPPVAARRLLQHTRNTIYFNAYKALRGERRLFDKILRERVVPNDRWSKLTLGWADRKNGKTAVTRYEDMLATPAECVARALREIGLDLPLKGDHVPTFAELKAIHPHFFRQGKSGAWQKDFPGDLSDTLWRVHGEAMRRFGYSE